MPAFNLDEYEPVDSRIHRFYEAHPEGRILTEVVSADDKHALVKASVFTDSDDERPRATGYAHEVAGSSPVNRSSWVENCECVPLTVPALTRNGWRFYHQIKEGDELLAFDGEQMRWTPCRKVSTFGPQPVVRIGNSRFSAVCTPNHKWYTDTDGLVEWQDVKRGRLMQAAPLADRGGSTDDAARLGWLFTDGSIKHVGGLASTAAVTQSKEGNFKSLTALFGTAVPVKADNREWGGARGVSIVKPAFRWSVPATEVRRVLGVFRVNDASDLMNAVCSMTRDEAESFYGAAMQADGWRQRFGKTNRHVVEAVRVAAMLTGRACGAITEKQGNEMTTKPLWMFTARTSPGRYVSEFTTEPLPPKAVWCPTTDHGTWVGLFDGGPSITGNTSAIGRALANLGMNVKGSRPSAEEMSRTVDEATRKRIVDVARGSNVSQERAQAIMLEVAGVSSTADLPAAKAEDVIARLKAEFNAEPA